jgi:hypothetical protein
VERSWKPVDAGIVDIIIGLIFTAVAIIFPFSIWNFGFLASLGTRNAVLLGILIGVVLLSLGLFTMYGGEMAMKRRRWGLALAASICASLIIFGLFSLILTILSKNEFVSYHVPKG